MAPQHQPRPKRCNTPLSSPPQTSPPQASTFVRGTWWPAQAGQVQKGLPPPTTILAHSLFAEPVSAAVPPKHFFDHLHHHPTTDYRPQPGFRVTSGRNRRLIANLPSSAPFRPLLGPALSSNFSSELILCFRPQHVKSA